MTDDYVMADFDGVVAIPESLVDEVSTTVEKALQTRSLVRKAILEGGNPKDAYLKYGTF